MAAFFYALLALTALIGAVGIVVLLLAARSDPQGRAAAALDDLAPAALPLAAVVATTATVGSLWFSEVSGFVPCELCWYQRIAMYPLAPVLGLAAVRGDRSIRPYGYVLAGSGAIMAAYHVVLQRVPNMDSVGCSADVPCSAMWVAEFGFVTIPFMALSGFLAIVALLTVAARVPSADTEPSAEEVLR
jgi:disulfide bond formation protein DsbB